MEIRIFETTMIGNYRILIDPDKKTLRCNKIDINKNPAVYAFCLKEISKSWPAKLEDNSICDASKIDITMRDEKTNKSFSFYGKYPDNFKKYNLIVKEIIDVYNQKSSTNKNI